MQINIDKKTGVLLAVIALLGATVISFAVNRDGDHMDNRGMNNNGMGGHMSNHSTSTSNYTGADIMFLQMMIPHHQQAVDISNLAMKTSKDSELLALAKKIAADQTSEIAMMKAWLKDAGAGTDMGHSMEGMGGMLNDAELSALNAETGTKFDLLWLKGMTGHHDGAIHMTTMIRDASNPDIKSFGEKVVADQSAQIEQMKAMITRLARR
jgi:uncharacterized protein (DUF305 family)